MKFFIEFHAYLHNAYICLDNNNKYTTAIFQSAMLRVSTSVISIILIAYFVVSCDNDTEFEVEKQLPPAPAPDTVRTQPVSTKESVSYVLTEGVVNWLGKRTIGNLHTGTIKVKSGELKVSQGRLVSGNIFLDMGTISVNNMKDPGAKADLEAHLKDSDFFKVKDYPTGEFRFEEVLPSNMPDFNWVVSGELTLKGKTNHVNIPVKMTITETELNAQSASFVINRTQWGIIFQSGLFGTAKDKIIEDIVPLSLTLKAKRN